MNKYVHQINQSSIGTYLYDWRVLTHTHTHTVPPKNTFIIFIVIIFFTLIFEK